MGAKGLRVLFVLTALVLVSAGCESAGSLVDLLPSPTPPPRATLPPSGQLAHVVAVHILAESQQPKPGTQIPIALRLDPVILTFEYRADGTLIATTYEPWPDHQVAEMQYCISAGNPCEPSGDWSAFTDQVEAAVGINWLGPRKLWAVARFRDKSGNPVPGMDENQKTSALARATLNLVASVDPNTPEAAQPPFVQTLAAATRTAYPVSGSVTIAQGRCCIGGKAGSRVEIPVAFAASSPVAPIADMRLAYACPTGGQNIQAPWEPFQPARIYATTAAINFTGWNIAVQYRDAKGNLSPVYCSQVSIEGNP